MFNLLFFFLSYHFITNNNNLKLYIMNDYEFRDINIMLQEEADSYAFQQDYFAEQAALDEVIYLTSSYDTDELPF